MKLIPLNACIFLYILFKYLIISIENKKINSNGQQDNLPHTVTPT